MWLHFALAFATEPDPAWVDSTVAAWTSLPREARIEALRAMVTSEADDVRRSALIRLGRLEQAWTADRPDEAYVVYVRELLLAPDGGRGSYLVAAAGFGGALGPDGQPTMSLEQARALYAERRHAMGVVAWHACAPPSGPLGAFQRAGDGGYWLVGALDGYRERRRPSGGIDVGAWDGARQCRDKDLDAGAGLGWTLFEGPRPVVDPRDLDGGPSGCTPLRLQAVGATWIDSKGGVRGGGEILDVQMPPRVQDCGTLAEWEDFAGALNARILSDLRLVEADVDDLAGSPSTMEGFRACASKRPTEATSELCAIR